jgi:hypothetical protein
MSETKDYIRVLYNKCYGGFSLSIEALLEYNKLSDKPLKSCYDLSEGIDCRTDPIALKVFDLLGSQKFSGKHANIQVEKIDAKYTNHIYISEYDGLECVQVNTRQYNIRDILTSKTLTDTEKVQELKKLLILNNI